MKEIDTFSFLKSVILGLSIVFSTLLSFSAYTQSADTVYLDGKIYTVNSEQQWAEAFAVKDDKFIHVGTNEDVKALIGPDTEVITLKNKMVMPGIHDMHAHPMQVGETHLFQCSFSSKFSIAEIVAKLKTCVDGVSSGTWIRGGQWAVELLSSDTVPHKSILDAVTTEHPIYLGDSTVHGAWLNSKALEVLGIDKNTPAPDGGVIVRDENGEPTGVLIDNAAYDVIKKIPFYTHEQYQQALTWSLTEMNKFGVVAVKDALVDGYSLRAYSALDKKKELTMRIAGSMAWKASWTETREVEQKNIDQRAIYKTDRVNPDFIKIFLDGIPPTRTSAMLDPYLPDKKFGSNFTGKLIHTPEQLTKDVIQLDSKGLTIKIHATGDRSVRVALDAFEAARKANGNDKLIHEISHAEFIHPNDIPRFKELNVAAEMCPIMWYPNPIILAMAKVIGMKKAQEFFPVKSLLDAGALTIYGSDWPSVVPDANPWPGIESMVTRGDPYANTPEPLWPEQAISLEQAIEVFTRNGAIAMKNEDKAGSIEAGKYADFIILDRNLFEIPVTEISDTQVLRTVLEGKIVYDNL